MRTSLTRLALTLLALTGASMCLGSERPWERLLRDAPGAELNSFHEEPVSVPQENGPAVIRPHAGVDVDVCGTAVMPLTQGTIVDVGWHDRFGRYVIVQDTDGLHSFFAHLRNDGYIPASREGSPVRRDADGRLEVIGYAGQTGEAVTGCHLHYERRTFPTEYLSAEQVQGTNCRRNVYPILDLSYARDKCFLEHWDDPNLPMIGQFEATAPRPPGAAEPASAPTPISAFDWTQAFREAYEDNNFVFDDSDPEVPPGERWLGRPYSNSGGSRAVHLWAQHGESRLSHGVLLQDLKAERPHGWHHGHTALIANVSQQQVFLIRTGFWNVYMNHGGAWNLGAPIGNEERVSGFVINGSAWKDEGSVQHFERGSLFFAEYLGNFYPTVDGIALVVDGQAAPLSNSLELRSIYQAFGISLRGNPYCQLPCVDMGMLQGFTYEFTSDVPLAHVQWRGVSGDSKGAAAPAPTLASDNHTFSFTAPSGAAVLELTPRDVFSSSFEAEEGNSLAVRLFDEFDGASFQSASWTAVGPASVTGGRAQFACGSSAHTIGKVSVAGDPIVIEAKFVGPGSLRDTRIELIDASNAANRIYVGDTNYRSDGLYTIGSGVFNLAQGGGGLSLSQYQEYRITVSGTSLTVQRGSTLGNLTETRQSTLATSIAGKAFHIAIGTGNPDYCPGEFDWIRVLGATVN